MLLNRLVDASKNASATRSRRAKVDALAGVLRDLPPEEIEAGTGFLYGELRQGRIGVGGAKIAQLRGVEPTQVAVLSVAEVDAAFERIAHAAGRGSSAERERELGVLFSRATGGEQSFLARLLLGELRQGAQEGLMIDAVAKAAELPLDRVRRAVMLSGKLPEVARKALGEGAPGLSSYKMELFRPVGPMLACTAEDLETALRDFEGGAAIEDKLDGARVQVHKSGDDIRIFSRQLNDVTTSLPDVVELARKLPARSAILDGEVIALRPDGRPQPFQVTMRRFGRSLEVDKLRGELPLTSSYFDLLLFDDTELIDRGNRERRDALTDLVGSMQCTRRIVTASPEEARAFIDQALAAGHEGAMIKGLESTYDAGRRGASWLKLKPTHSLDLVVLAVEWGSGRRQGFLSNLHLGARDPHSENFVMLGKTFKGMTDEMLAWQTTQLKGLSTGQQGHVVYVRPELVVEIAFDGIQKSTVYPGGMALRFARVKRYRLDKSAQEADTIETVRNLFQTGYGAPVSAM
ncbi:MAG TPA: ATP-dependent DNA ligase [Polyangiaceae bacterium]|nr:ATP-dependent DNA ligase [Polyangiaceae bacterium]